MKKIIYALFALLPVLAFAQNPVSWSYSAKKIGDKTYEVRISAKIQNKWHLYSQDQPAEAIVIPTSIIFGRHPLIKLNGKIKEVGKLEKYKDASIGIEQWQYSNSVEFVQTISLKTNVQTNISGNIEYQTCTDGKCLPPKMIEFSVKIE